MVTVSFVKRTEISDEISLPDGNEYIKRQTEEELKEYIRKYLLTEGIICTDICIEITVTDTETVIGGSSVYVSQKDLPKATRLLDGMAEVISDG